MEIKKLEKICKNLKDLFIEWHERHDVRITYRK